MDKIIPMADQDNAYKLEFDSYHPATLKKVDETPNTEIVRRFDYSPKREQAGYFDVVIWNLYSLLCQHYLKKGLTGAKNWKQSHKHAVILANNLSETSLQKGEGADVSTLKYLLTSAKQRKFAEMKLTKDFDVIFTDKKGGIVFEFNAKTLRKERIVVFSQEKRLDLQTDVAGGGKGQAGERKAGNGLEVGAEKKEKHFFPLPISYFRAGGMVKRTYILEAIRQTGAAPKVIEDQFRKKDVCAAYVMDLMIQEFGKGTISDSGLISFGKLPNAWDIKERALGAGRVEITASTSKNLKIDEKKGTVKVEDKASYAESLRAFFEVSDTGKVPSLITAFLRNSPYKKMVADANVSKPENMRSYNTHVLVCLGRENLKTVEAKWNIRLQNFLSLKTKVAPAFQRFLNVKIERANGDKIIVGMDGTAVVTKATGESEKTDIGAIRLSRGDKVSWQDVLLTDFYHGKERVMGLAFYASDPTNILMENYTLKDMPKETKFAIHDYIQIKAGKETPIEQIAEKLGLNDEQIQYYITALLDIGIDINFVSEKMLIPVFDINDVKTRIDYLAALFPQRLTKKNWLDVRYDIVAKRIADYNKESATDLFTLIRPGVDAWGQIGSVFSPYFKGENTLSLREKNLILRAVDESCPNIKLSLNPPILPAGDTIYLTKKRIAEIVQYVREVQAKQFGPDDYVYFVKSRDKPEKFISFCFDAEVKILEFLIPFQYKGLDAVEKDYLLSALKATNTEVDLNTVGEGEVRKYVDFQVGARLVFRKIDLRKCIYDIYDKRKLQAPVKALAIYPKGGFGGVTVMHASMVNFLDREKTIAKDFERVRDIINEVYSGESVDDAVIRSILYFVWGNEQGRGEARKTVKGIASFVDSILGTNLVNSVGEFQLRQYENDIAACRPMFEKFGIPVPSNKEELRDLVRSNVKAATIVAGERVRASLTSFRGFMAVNGEKADFTDENFAIMLLTSVNRPMRNIYMTVFQTWAVNLASTAGIRSEVSPDEIDSKIPDNNRYIILKDNVYKTFKNVVEKLIAAGEIIFAGSVDGELDKMFTDREFFVKGPLFQELQRWYQKKNGRRLSFVLSMIERERGDHIFSYGARMLGKQGTWAKVFVDQGALSASVERMQAQYNPQPFVPQRIALEEEILASNEKSPADALKENSDLRECFDGNMNATIYASSLRLKDDPNGRRIASLFFGTVVKLEGVAKQGASTYIRVSVVSGEKIGERGYLPFKKQWFSNRDGPKIPDDLASEVALEIPRKDSTVLPKDYVDNLNKYLRFLANYGNPKEPESSVKLMERSKPMVSEVVMPQQKTDLLDIARVYGYNGQKFFGILPKRGAAGILGQNFYLIDTSRDRILRFTISTGRGVYSTPAGHYDALNTGFKALDAFGKFRRGVKKHIRARAQNLTAGTPGMTTGLIPIMRQGSDQKSEGMYFHGTNREDQLSLEASHGCVRMSNLDIVYFASLLNGEPFEFQVVESGQELAQVLNKGRAIAKQKKGGEIELASG